MKYYDVIFANRKVRKKITPSADTVFNNIHVPKQVDECIRFDGLNHFIGSGENKSRCALYGKTIKLERTKCDVTVHDYCLPTFR